VFISPRSLFVAFGVALSAAALTVTGASASTTGTTTLHKPAGHHATMAHKSATRHAAAAHKSATHHAAAAHRSKAGHSTVAHRATQKTANAT
jgi:hypothetical protein